MVAPVYREIEPLLACQKVASDLGLGGGFHRVLRFPPPITTGVSQISRNMAEKETKKQNSKFL